MEQAIDNPAGSYHHKHNLKIYISLLIIIAAFAGITSLLNLKGYSQDFRSRADQASDDRFCPNQPDCCAKIVETGDPLACGDFIERMYCPLNVCAAITAQRKQRCGWYWIWHDKNNSPNKNLGTNAPNGYGCMIGDSESTMHPRYTPSGTTITPRPLFSPTPLPTRPFVPTSSPGVKISYTW